MNPKGMQSGQLDSSISAYKWYVENRPQSEWNAHVFEALKSAKAYRLSHPHPVSLPLPQVPVSDILSNVDVKPGN
jgi:hypothetical protein